MARQQKGRGKGESMRLARYIASAGIAARRKAEDLIRAGSVEVNGVPVTDVATNVTSGKDNVSVNGKAIVPEPLFYALFNKPKGCITAMEDPWDRPTVMDYMAKVPARVKPVGRLDYYSEGVLLLTNDGDLAAALLGPASAIEKTYHVKVRGKVTDRHLHILREGVRIGARTVTREAQVDRLNAKSKHDWLVITLTEGKSRQIHRMLEALDLSVTKLQRVVFAGLSFHGLRVGDARELSQGEVNDLRQRAGLPRNPNAVARGVWTAKREDTELGRRARARLRVEREALEAAEGRGPGARGEGSEGSHVRAGPRAQGDRDGGRPSRSSSGKPRPSSGGKPRSSSGGKPRASSGGKPRASSGGKPRPSSGGKPRPSSGGKPRPSSGGKPRPSSGKPGGGRGHGKPSGRKPAGKRGAGRGRGSGNSGKR